MKHPRLDNEIRAALKCFFDWRYWLKVIIVTLAVIGLLSLTGCSVISEPSKYCDPYASVGAGYKTAEAEIRWDDGHTGSHPVSARMTAGCSYQNIRYGLHHRSQWFTGAPFNDRMEPHTTEVFVDYVWD